MNIQSTISDLATKDEVAARLAHIEHLLKTVGSAEGIDVEYNESQRSANIVIRNIDIQRSACLPLLMSSLGDSNLRAA